MKVKISAKKNLTIFIVAFLICGVAFFLCCINLFIFTKPWTYIQWLLIGLYLTLSIFLLIISFITNYYVINETNFEVHRFGKITIYDYKNIIFIDELEASKHHNIAFMVKSIPSMRYLSFDKEGLLYNKMMEKSKNLMSREEFHGRFPNVRL